MNMVKIVMAGFLRGIKNVFLGLSESFQDTLEEIKDGQIKMVTSDSRSRNKRNYSNSVQIYNVKFLSSMLKNKITLFKTEIIILDEIISECRNYCLENDLDIYELELDLIPEINFNIELNETKINFLNEHKKFLCLEINKSAISVKNFIKCEILASELKQNLINDINFTLQNIYEYNDMLTDLDVVTLDYLYESINNSIQFIDSIWAKAEFYENLYEQINEYIIERIDSFDNNEEKAFSSKKTKVFTITNEFNTKKIIESEQSRLIYKYNFNKEENMYSLYIPIYRLRETASLIEKAQNNLSEEILDKIEPIGESINIKY